MNITRVESLPYTSYTAAEARAGLVPPGQVTESGSIIRVETQPGELLAAFVRFVKLQQRFRQPVSVRENRLPVEQRPGK